MDGGRMSQETGCEKLGKVIEELTGRLEEDDKLLRDAMAKAKDNRTCLACLMRARADLQSCITNLLGAGA
jgi:hypothetical protein